MLLPDTLVLPTAGLFGMAAVAANSIITYQSKLQQFLAEIGGDDGSPMAGPPGKAD